MKRSRSKRIATVAGAVLAAVGVIGAATTVGTNRSETARQAGYAKPFRTTLTATIPANARQFKAINVSGRATSPGRRVTGQCEVQSRRPRKAWRSAGFASVINGRCTVKAKFPLAGRVQARMRFTAFSQFKDAATTPVFIQVVATKDTVKPKVTLTVFPEVTSDPAGIAVTYFPSANDDRDGVVKPTCTPPSGSVFPVGNTTITCTARDKAGNVGTASAVQTVTLSP
jgi:hypothetical protein